MMGCASTREKDANKNLFEQALVLQKVNASTDQAAQLGTQVDKIQWQFEATQFQPNAKQKRELYLWFSQLESYSSNPILLQLGPDWMSSYKRGNNIRKMIPRGIIIEQKFDASLPKNQVIFSLKVSQPIVLEKGGRYEPSSQ